MTARRTPLWRIFAVAAAGGALIPATGPVNDLDVYWHVRVGDLIVRTRSLPTRELWDFPAAGRRWVPHSWLSDVVLSLAHKAGGWSGVVALRLVVGVALLALVARAVIAGTDAVAGPLVFGVAAVALGPHISDRPQLFAMVLLGALLPLLDRARAGRAPHLLAAAGLGWLWASLHGSWPLLPALLVLAALCAALDRVNGARRLLLAALAAVAGAAVTPAGPALLARPFLVARATQAIAEWQPTVLWSRNAAAFLVVVVALVAGWALTRTAVPPSELLWCGAVVAAALAVVRNVPFAVILLAPMVARRLSAVIPEGRRSTIPAWTIPVTGAVAGLLVGTLAVTSPALPADAPTALIATLNAQPGEVRVLNDFNVGGFLTGFAGPRVSAAVDGRVDAFSPGFLDRYVAAMNLRGDWEGLVAELHPTHALLDARLPIAEVLERERGWHRLGANDVFVLLAAP